MPDNATTATATRPEEFLASVEPAAKREDARVLDALFRRVTGVEPAMWNGGIIGYGSYHYRYASGHEGRASRVGFSPRKARLSLYLSGCDGGDADPAFDALLVRLGKHQRGAACLYVNKLADIDLAVLEEMAALSWKQSLQRWPED